VIIFLHIRNVAERDGNGIGEFVADADSVHGGGKLTGVRRHKEHEDGRNNRKVFNDDIEKVKELLRSHGVIAGNVKEHGLGSVNVTALIRRKQKNKNNVENHEKHDSLENRADLFPFRLRKNENGRDNRNHRQQDAGVVRQGTRQAPQDEKDQLGDAAQGMDPGIFLHVGKHFPVTHRLPPSQRK